MANPNKERNDLKLGSQPKQMSIGQLAVLAEGTIATLLRFCHHKEPHRDPDDEVFTHPEIVFTVRDRWHFQSEGGTFEINPERVVLARAGQHYRCRHCDPIPQDENISVQFHPHTLQDLLSRYPPFDGERMLEEHAFRHAVLPRSPGLRGLQQALLAEAAQKEAGYRLKVDLIAMELLVESLRLSSDLVIYPSRPVDSRYRERIEPVKAYLEAHLAEEVDLVSLSRAAALSPYYLSRLFKAHVGISPHQYLIRIRIKRAAELLQNSSLTVTQVCYQVGFNSLSHFITTFRQHTGLTPSQYRHR